MLLKYFYDPRLAHASYLIGCQRTGEALVVDPGRDIEPYLRTAESEGMRITGVTETHIHADFVSGARELAERTGARLYLSDEGPAEWKYQYLDGYDHQLLKEGDTFSVGNVELKVMHTPGHTPESLSFVLTDKGGGADRPMGIFTGDFIFVGSIGRPDLLEEAAGLAGTAEPGARELYQSMQRFRELPDYLQVWPAHGAGSACGKGLGAIPSSTVGYEKLFNPALQYTDEQEFVDYILADQPEPPKYFAVMKRVNKEGPAVLGDAPLPTRKSLKELPALVQQGQVIDTAVSRRYLNAHVPGTINIEPRNLAMWGGSLIDYDQPVYLIASPNELPEIVRILRKIGVEQIGGYFDEDEVADAGLKSAHIEQATPEELKARVEAGEVELIDVRGKSERAAQWIPGSEYLFLGKMLPGELPLEKGKTYAFQCRSGSRSAIAASIAEREGFASVINLTGGITAWKKAGFPVTSESSTPVPAGS